MVNEIPSNDQNGLDEQSPENNAGESPAITMEGVLSSKVISNLQALNSRCQKAMGIYTQEQINQLLINNRYLVGKYFSEFDLLKDQRVKNIIRYLDCCFEIGFIVDVQFCKSFLVLKNAEESIRRIKELMRACVVLIADRLGSRELPVKLKISAIRRDGSVTWQFAEIIVFKAMKATVEQRGGSTEELLALLMLIGECLKD